MINRWALTLVFFFKNLLASGRGLLLLFPFLWGCATYQSHVRPARELLREGKATEAAELLRPKASTENGDQLAYLLDYATILQIAGRYKESTQAFLQAHELAELQDYHSVSRITGSLLLNEEAKQYKGDTFEKVFINAQLAMNFLAVNDLDAALVEARRINEKYLKLRSEESKQFELNSFAKYLSALIWEAHGSFDDAAIAYEEAYKIDPLISGIETDLVRANKMARRESAYSKWKKTFPSVQDDPNWQNRTTGELIVLVQQGWGPVKDFAPHDYTWPVLRQSDSRTKTVRLKVEGLPQEVESRSVYDVEKAAIQTLEEDRLSLLGRRLLGVAVKDAVAQELNRKENGLGTLAWIFMNIADRADLRQWSMLPESIQIVRLSLPPGSYQIHIHGYDGFGIPSSEQLELQDVQIFARKKTFRILRTVR